MSGASAPQTGPDASAPASVARTIARAGPRIALDCRGRARDGLMHANLTGAAIDAAIGKARDFMMPPQRKHERPLTRRIQCWRRLKLETTEADGRRRVGGTCKYNNRIRKSGAGIGRHWNAQHRQSGHLRDGELHLSGALIVGRALLQARVLVHRLGAAAFMVRLGEGHGGRLRRADAGVRGADRLREQQGSGHQPARQFTIAFASGKGHVSILNRVRA